MIKTIALFIALLPLSLYAQDNTPAPTVNGELTIYGDSAVSDLVNKHISINKKKCPNLVKGYRVQIFSSAGAGSREKANADRAKFLSLYSELNAYNVWEQPNWKVRVGDCRTRFEAEKIRKEIQAQFPNSFVVNDYIDSFYIENCD